MTLDVNFEDEVREVLGPLYDKFLDAIDDGSVDIGTAKDIATKLHTNVGVRLKQASKKNNFEFNRRTMRAIMSYWYEICVPEDKDVTRKQLINILRDKDIRLNAVALDLEKLNEKSKEKLKSLRDDDEPCVEKCNSVSPSSILRKTLCILFNQLSILWSCLPFHSGQSRRYVLLIQSIPKSNISDA